MLVAPAQAMDPCEVDFGPAPETPGERLGGSPPTWNLPPVGKWRVSRRDTGRRVAEGCGLGVIEAPLVLVRDVIDRAADFDEFMPRMLASEVEPVSPGVYLNRQVLDMPFPAADRRYTVRVEAGTIETGAGPGWQARWSYVEGSGNIRESEGSWTLVPLQPERTVVVYRLVTDPGGRLPAWIVDRAALRTLRRVLRAVRERALSAQASRARPAATTGHSATQPG